MAVFGGVVKDMGGEGSNALWETTDSVNACLVAPYCCFSSSPSSHSGYHVVVVPHFTAAVVVDAVVRVSSGYRWRSCLLPACHGLV